MTMLLSSPVDHELFFKGKHDYACVLRSFVKERISGFILTWEFSRFPRWWNPGICLFFGAMQVDSIARKRSHMRKIFQRTQCKWFSGSIARVDIRCVLASISLETGCKCCVCVHCPDRMRRHWSHSSVHFPLIVCSIIRSSLVDSTGVEYRGSHAVGTQMCSELVCHWFECATNDVRYSTGLKKVNSTVGIFSLRTIWFTFGIFSDGYQT